MMVKNLKKTIPFIIITLVAAGGVEIFYRVAFTRLMRIDSSPQGTVAAEVVATTATEISTIQKKQPDIQTILKRKLFGPSTTEIKAAPAVQPPPVQLAITALDLTLLGTITGAPNNRRTIILDKKMKVQDIYYQGDTVQGALIKEIQRGKVILTVNGKDEILVPETPKTNAAAGPSPAFSSPPPPEPAAQEPAPDAPAESVVEPEPIEPPIAPPIEPAAPANNPAVPNQPGVNTPPPDHQPQNPLPPNTNINEP